MIEAVVVSQQIGLIFKDFLLEISFFYRSLILCIHSLIKVLDILFKTLLNLISYY